MNDYRPVAAGSPATSWHAAAHTFATDLDRCEHGRHISDPCVGSGTLARDSHGPNSEGNPVLTQGWDVRTRSGERVVAFAMGGDLWVAATTQDVNGPHVRLTSRTELDVSTLG